MPSSWMMAPRGRHLLASQMLLPNPGRGALAEGGQGESRHQPCPCDLAGGCQGPGDGHVRCVFQRAHQPEGHQRRQVQGPGEQQALGARPTEGPAGLWFADTARASGSGPSGKCAQPPAGGEAWLEGSCCPLLGGTSFPITSGRTWAGPVRGTKSCRNGGPCALDRAVAQPPRACPLCIPASGATRGWGTLIWPGQILGTSHMGPPRPVAHPRNYLSFSVHDTFIVMFLQ